MQAGKQKIGAPAENDEELFSTSLIKLSFSVGSENVSFRFMNIIFLFSLLFVHSALACLASPF